MHPIPLHDILGVLGLIFGFMTFPVWGSFVFAVVAHGFNCLKKYSKGYITVVGAVSLYGIYIILMIIDSIKHR